MMKMNLLQPTQNRDHLVPLLSRTLKSSVYKDLSVSVRNKMVYYSKKGETTCSCGKPGPTWRLGTIYRVNELKKK